MSEKLETKKTPLYGEHLNLKAKLVPFGGWLMPVSYSSVLDEHKHVREKVGIFDVSHMGEIFVSGKDCLSFLNFVTVNDAAKLKVGEGQYSTMLNENGGMVDDLILYKIRDDQFLVCVNASNIEKDYSWLKHMAKDFNVLIENQSASWSQIAIQGPLSKAVLKSVLKDFYKLSLEELTKFDLLNYMGIQALTLNSHEAFIARTGYTGEIGYEIYLKNEIVSDFWTKLLSQKNEWGETLVKPIGLGARDTLRLEASYLLYGNDANDHTSPLEADIAFCVKFTKTPKFFSQSFLETQKAQGLQKKLCALKILEDGIPRSGMKVFAKDEPSLEIGQITSGSVLPTMGGAGGLAYIKTGPWQNVGSQVLIEIRGKKILAELVKKPFYVAKTKS